MSSITAILLFSVVCLSILAEIQGASPSRDRSRSPNRRSFFEQAGKNVSRSINRVLQSVRRGSSPEAASSTGGVGLYGARSGSSSPESRSRISSSQPSNTSAQSWRSLPSNYKEITEASPGVFQYLDSQKAAQGNSQMTPNEFKRIKKLLIQTANIDYCSTMGQSNSDLGYQNCVKAFYKFKEIPRGWRGPCWDSFVAVCHLWPDQIRRCSFFMKSVNGSNSPLKGYVHSLKDCAKALDPDSYASQQYVAHGVDNWIAA